MNLYTVESRRVSFLKEKFRFVSDQTCVITSDCFRLNTHTSHTFSFSLLTGHRTGKGITVNTKALHFFFLNYKVEGLVT